MTWATFHPGWDDGGVADGRFAAGIRDPPPPPLRRTTRAGRSPSVLHPPLPPALVTAPPRRRSAPPPISVPPPPPPLDSPAACRLPRRAPWPVVCRQVESALTAMARPTPPIVRNATRARTRRGGALPEPPTTGRGWVHVCRRHPPIPPRPSLFFCGSPSRDARLLFFLVLRDCSGGGRPCGR